jgi:hypothetical protein
MDTAIVCIPLRDRRVIPGKWPLPQGGGYGRDADVGGVVRWAGLQQQYPGTGVLSPTASGFRLPGSPGKGAANSRKLRKVCLERSQEVVAERKQSTAWPKCIAKCPTKGAIFCTN